jgi:hypothetical protein
VAWVRYSAGVTKPIACCDAQTADAARAHGFVELRRHLRIGAAVAGVGPDARRSDVGLVTVGDVHADRHVDRTLVEQTRRRILRIHIGGAANRGDDALVGDGDAHEGAGRRGGGDAMIAGAAESSLAERDARRILDGAADAVRFLAVRDHAGITGSEARGVGALNRDRHSSCSLRGCGRGGGVLPAVAEALLLSVAGLVVIDTSIAGRDRAARDRRADGVGGWRAADQRAEGAVDRRVGHVLGRIAEPGRHRRLLDR